MPPDPRPRLSRGFTLIELMIVVAIVALLATVALPSFFDQVRKGRRADVVDATAAVQQAQERWRANNVAYSTSFTDLRVGSTSPGGYYTLALSAASATGYTLTATAVAGKSQARDTGCTTLTVTVVAGVATQAPAQCWSR